MQEINNDTNIVETLRLKTEESEINQYLKRTLGGYTKSSVLQYLNMLRKQQQSMEDTFSNNKQMLFNEKEELKKANDALQARINRIESEYNGLSQSIRIHELGDEETSGVDTVTLKNNISALEQELNKNDIEKSHLDKQIEQHKFVIDDISLKLDQSNKEILSLKEMLKTEMLKSKDQSAIISKLSAMNEEKDEEINFLNSLVSKGELANLKSKVNELTEQLSSQSEVLSTCNSEIDLKSKTIEILTQENDDNKQRITDLWKNTSELSYQNDKLQESNKALSQQLESQYKKNISLIKEKSGITMDKLLVTRKLDEANSELMVLEMKVNKQINSEKAERENNNLNQAE